MGRPVAQPDLSRPLDPRTHGAKAANLHRLIALGHRVPSGRVIGVEELRGIGSVDLSWVDPDRAYAVRSSA